MVKGVPHSRCHMSGGTMRMHLLVCAYQAGKFRQQVSETPKVVQQNNHTRAYSGLYVYFALMISGSRDIFGGSYDPRMYVLYSCGWVNSRACSILATICVGCACSRVGKAGSNDVTCVRCKRSPSVGKVVMCVRCKKAAFLTQHQRFAILFVHRLKTSHCPCMTKITVNMLLVAFASDKGPLPQEFVGSKTSRERLALLLYVGVDYFCTESASSG